MNTSIDLEPVHGPVLASTDALAAKALELTQHVWQAASHLWLPNDGVPFGFAVASDGLNVIIALCVSNMDVDRVRLYTLDLDLEGSDRGVDPSGVFDVAWCKKVHLPREIRPLVAEDRHARIQWLTGEIAELLCEQRPEGLPVDLRFSVEIQVGGDW